MTGKGEIFYGMHFYPGVAQYEDPDKEPFRVLINEDTIRKMGPSFAGRPIFVEHVEEVEEDVNQLRNEADGWVMESFFNAADGKNWVKFIVVSDRGMTAIRRGFRLSNAYIPKSFGDGGLWNGVAYEREVTDGEYEHLAIVRNPRYEESVIMTPVEFKQYNDDKTIELKRLANSKGESKVKFFKKTKVENSVDLESMIVELPKSKQEMSVTKIINDYDTILNMNGYANGDHMVKVGEKDEMSVNDLVKKHMEVCNEFEDFKKKQVENAASEDGGEPGPDDEASVDNESEESKEAEKDVGDRGGDENLENAEEEKEEKEPKEDKVKNDKAVAKAKAAALKNAHLRHADEEEVTISLAEDQVARGKSRYGSGN